MTRLCGTVNLQNCGHAESLRVKKPIIDNEPGPWYCYSSIYFLEDKLTKDMDVFEYGCGHSTIWYSKRVKSICSVDHNKEWVDKISAITNTKIIHKKKGYGYVTSVIDQERLFDIIVVDGYAKKQVDGVDDHTDRDLCLQMAPTFLKQNGVIILDNSDNPKWDKSQQWLLDNGFKRLEFFGLGPQSTWFWGTTIFYRQENILGI